MKKEQNNKFTNQNGNDVTICPVCNEKGFIKFDAPILCGSIFKIKLQVADCPLCDAWGMIEIKAETDEADSRDTTKGDLYSGGSPFFEEF